MTKPTLAENLRSLALFSHLSEAKLQELSRFLQELRFEAGEVIFEEGSHGDSLFLVAEGHIQIQKKLESAEGFKELARLSPGDFFGEMALIEETPRSARAVAQTGVLVFQLARKELFSWLNSQPVMALGFFVELMRVFSQRLRHTSEELALLYDVSHLILGEFSSEKIFLADILRHVVPHLDGEWSAGAYLQNIYTEDIERVATYGPAALPENLTKDQVHKTGWVDAQSFRALLPGDRGPLGAITFVTKDPLSPRERNEASVTLTTVAHLVSSALLNIAHRIEEMHRSRLDQQTRGSVQM